MKNTIKHLLLRTSILLVTACGEPQTMQADSTEIAEVNYHNSTLIVDEHPGLATGGTQNFPPGRIVHYAENGEVIFESNMLKMPHDAWSMQDGTYWVSLIRENALWHINTNSEVLGVLPIGVYPTSFSVLENGNILVSGWDDDHPGLVREYDPTGNIVWRVEDLVWPWKAQRLANGNTMIADAGSNRVFEVAPDGTIVWEFSGLAPEKNELFEHLGPTYVDRIDNGNTLISGRGVDRIIEVDQAGDIVWEVGAPLIDAQYSAVRLKNGNTLITDQGHDRVIEIDRDKNIVWQKDGFGYAAKAYRLD